MKKVQLVSWWVDYGNQRVPHVVDNVLLGCSASMAHSVSNVVPDPNVCVVNAGPMSDEEYSALLAADGYGPGSILTVEDA